PNVKGVPPVKKAPYLDAVALTDADRSLITIMIANTHPEKAIPTIIELSSWPIPKILVGRQISGDSFMTRNSLDDPDRVTIREINQPATIDAGQLKYTVPPHSVTELVFRK
ncbi:MAG: hypothetical protein JSV03_08470, partial [Planctomycetota bacterium]